MGTNNGLIVGRGGQVINNGALAVGYKARAEQFVQAAGAALDEKGLRELRVELDAVSAALRQHGDRLDDPQTAFELVERTAKEVVQDKPDKLNLKGWLTQLVDTTKSVAEIAKAAMSLKDLVVGLF